MPQENVNFPLFVDRYQLALLSTVRQLPGDQGFLHRGIWVLEALRLISVGVVLGSLIRFASVSGARRRTPANPLASSAARLQEPSDSG
jgi:hypothetical protein